MVSNEQGRNDYFGNSVVASSDHLFVRERDDGEIVFYQFDRLTGQSLDIIALSDVTTGDYGWLQDAKSNLALFGSGFSNSLYGKATLFDLETSEVLLTINSPGAEARLFGVGRMALADSFIAISAYGDSGDGGAVYTFDYDTGEMIQKIVPDDLASGMEFGRQLIVDGDMLLVSSVETETAYLFNGNTGEQLAKYEAADVHAREFGFDLAMNDELVFVADRTHSELAEYAGAVFVFDRLTGNFIEKIYTPDPTTNSRFGTGGLAIFGSTLFVGQPRDSNSNGNQAGAVHRFDIPTRQYRGRLIASDGVVGDQFGGSMAMYGNSLIVGAAFVDSEERSSGKAYAFNISTLVNPTEVSVTQGVPMSGSIESLAESDGEDYSVSRNQSSLFSEVTMELSATSSSMNPGSMALAIEGSVFARGTVTQAIDIFDFESQAWEQVSLGNATRFVDSRVQVQPAGNLARFVGPDGLLRSRLRFQGSTRRMRFTSNLDQVEWIIIP